MLQIYSCVRNVIEIVIIFLFVYKSLLYSVISLYMDWYTLVLSTHRGTMQCV